MTFARIWSKPISEATFIRRTRGFVDFELEATIISSSLVYRCRRMAKAASKTWNGAVMSLFYMLLDGSPSAELPLPSHQQCCGSARHPPSSLGTVSGSRWAGAARSH
jgi:hypothetical protein